MLPGSTSTVNLEAIFDWLKPDAAILISVIKAKLISLNKVNADFSGKIEKQGPLDVTLEYEFKSLDDWAKAFEKGLTSTYIRINIPDSYTISMLVYFNFREIICRARCSEDEIMNIWEFFQAIQKDLDLVKKRNRSYVNDLLFRERNYYVPKPLSPRDFLDSLTVFYQNISYQNMITKFVLRRLPDRVSVIRTLIHGTRVFYPSGKVFR